MWPFTPEVVRLAGRSSGAPGAGRRVSLPLGSAAVAAGRGPAKIQRPRCLSKLAWSSSGSLSFFFALCAKGAAALRLLTRLLYLLKIRIRHLLVAAAVGVSGACAWAGALLVGAGLWAGLGGFGHLF